MKQKDEDLVRRLEQAEEKHLDEKKNMQEKLDALHGEKVRMEDTLAEIHVTLSQKDKAMKQLQESLGSTVAQLAAFAKSLSSLHIPYILLYTLTPWSCHPHLYILLYTLTPAVLDITLHSFC